MARSIEKQLDEETVWYLEHFDLLLEDWSGVHPYTEWHTVQAAREGYAKYKQSAPGVQLHLVREMRIRYVVDGPIEAKRSPSRSVRDL